jgi:hypothetical protein
MRAETRSQGERLIYLLADAPGDRLALDQNIVAQSTDSIQVPNGAFGGPLVCRFPDLAPGSATHF